MYHATGEHISPQEAAPSWQETAPARRIDQYKWRFCRELLAFSACSARLSNVRISSIAEVSKWFPMGVSINGGTPKPSILMGNSFVNHPFWGIPIYGNLQMYPVSKLYGTSVFFNLHCHILPTPALLAGLQSPSQPQESLHPKPTGFDNC